MTHGMLASHRLLACLTFILTGKQRLIWPEQKSSSSTLINAKMKSKKAIEPPPRPRMLSSWPRRGRMPRYVIHVLVRCRAHARALPCSLTCLHLLPCLLACLLPHLLACLQAHLADMMRAIEDGKAQHGESARKRKRTNESPWWQFFVRKAQDKEDPGVHRAACLGFVDLSVLVPGVITLCRPPPLLSCDLAYSSPLASYLVFVADYNLAYCLIPTKQTTDSAAVVRDGRLVNVTHGPSNLEKFIRSNYSQLWCKIDKEKNPQKYAKPSEIGDLLDSLPGKMYGRMVSTLSDDVDNELVQWLMESDRPRNCANDDGLAALVKKVQVLPGMYELPSEDKLDKAYKRQGQRGRDRAREWYLQARAEGRKITIAGDIWTDGDMSLLAIVGYVIRDGWTWSKCVIAVVEFSTNRHTAIQIKSATAASLRDTIGMESMHDEVFRKVSDAGSNMKSGWRGFAGGDQTCCDHMIERSTMVYHQLPEIAGMKKRRKELTNHLNTSTVSQMDKAVSEELFDLTSTKATRGNATRWRSEHASSRWHRQRGPMLNDLKHCSGNAILEEKCLSASEQVLNDEQESVLDPAARVSLALEPDTAPTISLALPLMSAVIKALDGDHKVIGGGIVPHDSLHSASQTSRKAVRDDFLRRWDEEIDPDWLVTMQIATFCDPRHKDFELKHLGNSARKMFKKAAIQNAHDMYELEFEQFANVMAPPSTPELPGAQGDPDKVADKERADSLKKSYAVDVCGLLGRGDSDGEVSGDEEVLSEWDRYLQLPQVSIKTDLLDWWRLNEDQFPSIAKMAMQVLSCPACSSGVERLFSKAGRNHTKLQQSTKESTMCDVLFSSNMSKAYLCI